MNDMYSEKLLRRAPSPRIIAIKAAIVFATLSIGYLVFFIFCSSTKLIGFMPIAVAAVIFAGWKGFTFLNTEFEYVVTNGSLDVDKIVARKSRKRIVSVTAKNIEILAPNTQEYTAPYASGSYNETIDARSSEKAEGWFVIGQSEKNGRVKILFEPSEKMLYIFERFIPSKMPCRPQIDERYIL